MVSLKDRITYLKEFEDKPKILPFIGLINGEKNIAISDSTIDTDKSYFEMIKAISVNSKKEFKMAYEDFAKRKPSDESPWLYNDFFVFVILLGVVKYSVEKKWIEEVLALRNNLNTEFQSINQTLKNLLSGNLSSTDNLHEIVIVYQETLNQPQLSQDLLDITYLKLSNQTDLLEKHNDFMAVISLRAYDVIITTKDTPDAVEVRNLKNFKVDFEKRALIIGDALYYTILISIIIIVFYYYKESKGFKDFVDDVGAVFSIIGIALLAWIKFVRKWIRGLIKSIFGFKKNFK